jgi:hypothetical protein
MSEKQKCFISVRQTQKGDWLIFRPEPHTLGVGIKKAFTPTSGYTTGHQYGRADTEQEAIEAAKAIMREKTNQYYEWVLIEWIPPTEKNPQFCDLPKLHPTAKRYDSKEAMELDGWIYINPSKTIAHYRGRTIYVTDVTPGASFGYDLAVTIKGVYNADGVKNVLFAKSSEVWHEDEYGKSRFSTRFKSGDIVDAIAAAKAWIDQDLITISEAAKILGTSVQNISQMVNRESLDSWANETANGSRQAARLVSKYEVMKRK